VQRSKRTIRMLGQAIRQTARVTPPAKEIAICAAGVLFDIDRTITAGHTDLPHARLGYRPSFVAIPPERLDHPAWYAFNPWFCLRIGDGPPYQLGG
jgi:hypothetical protein